MFDEKLCVHPVVEEFDEPCGALAERWFLNPLGQVVPACHRHASSVTSYSAQTGFRRITREEAVAALVMEE